eukprot:jgi/Psemu1/70691/estExt_Genemark1.C_35130004
MEHTPSCQKSGCWPPPPLPLAALSDSSWGISHPCTSLTSRSLPGPVSIQLPPCGLWPNGRKGLTAKGLTAQASPLRPAPLQLNPQGEGEATVLEMISFTNPPETPDSLKNRTSILLATAYPHNIPKKSTRPRIRIHPSWPLEGTANDIVGDLLYSSPNGVATKNTTRAIEMMTKWIHNDNCFEGFSRVARDPRSKVYLQRDETIQGGDPFISIPPFMQSDFLYIPTRATKQYEGIAQLLLDHDIHLECAMPTIVAEVLDASKNMHFQPIGLCTIEDDSLVPKFPPPKTPLHSPYEVIHPIKINIQGYSNWDRAFDWATTGILSFDLKDYA